MLRRGDRWGGGVRRTVPWLGEVFATLFAQPDEVMLELGAGGELLVARIRAMLSAVSLLLPLANAIGGARIGETVIGLATTTIVYRIQRLVELSGRDGLTGLPNRMWLLQQMPRFLDVARGQGA